MIDADKIKINYAEFQANIAANSLVSDISLLELGKISNIEVEVEDEDGIVRNYQFDNLEGMKFDIFKKYKKAGIKFADSDQVKIGHTAISIGSPFGLGMSASQGIVSALDRKINHSYFRNKSYIQTDAAMNAGNSGGILINLNGEIIGINTAILGQSNRGIGFSIPSNTASKVIEELKKVDIKHPARLGMLVENVSTTRIPHSPKLRYGVIILDIDKNFPAYKAGLRAHDVITRIGNRPVPDIEHLHDVLQQYSVNDTVDVTYKRTEPQDKLVKKTVKVKLTGCQLMHGIEIKEVNKNGTSNKDLKISSIYSFYDDKVISPGDTIIAFIEGDSADKIKIKDLNSFKEEIINMKLKGYRNIDVYIEKKDKNVTLERFKLC